MREKLFSKGAQGMISEEIRYLRQEAFALSEKYEQLKQRNAVLERALKQACRHLNMLHKMCFRREWVQYYPSVYIVEAEEELGREKE